MTEGAGGRSGARGAGGRGSRDGGDTAAGRPAESEPSAEEPGVVDRADYDPDYDPDVPVICEVCGGVMEYTAACKLVCRNCGYTRDCSDP